MRRYLSADGHVTVDDDDVTVDEGDVTVDDDEVTLRCENRHYTASKRETNRARPAPDTTPINVHVATYAQRRSRRLRNRLGEVQG